MLKTKQKTLFTYESKISTEILRNLMEIIKATHKKERSDSRYLVEMNAVVKRILKNARDL